MNKTMITVFFGVFLVGVVSLAMAVTDESGENVARTLGTAENMTVGQCVAAAAAVKNTCFDTVKDTRATCKVDAKNVTEPKPALKACTTTFKKDLKQCKMDFKADKKECKALKQKRAGK